MDQLQAMRVFCQVVDAGSMAAAARVLDLAPASVTATISRLERHLGVSLLQRSTRALAMTEAGRLWYGQARQILQQAQAAEEAVRRHAREPHGQLRVTTTPGVAAHFIYPWLADFCHDYPHIEVELLIDHRVLDLQGEGIDLALRTGHLADSSLIALPLLHYHHLTCASPAYLARHGVPQHPRELAAHTCLTYRRHSRWRFQHEGEMLEVAVSGRHVSNDARALLAWALAGEGLLRQPDWLLAEALRQGQLQAVLTPFTLSGRQRTPLSAVLPQQGLRPRKVDVFLSALRAFLAQDSRDIYPPEIKT
ncbi:LysR family transcriptional regulator [Paludibacterium sp. B53371]|uniref:LysR family transcriptional regulator n=1 Tax=Paludibacterium sp. B53371 TaxID=2806263 RepID=UPI001C048E98|nr:LysR family transcriptional regulator [Paludibacterium sp. B53371]